MADAQARQTHWRYLTAAFFVLVTAILTSCSFVADAPRALVAPREPARYFRLAVDLVLDGQTIPVSHTWHCAQSTQPSAADGKWHLNWYRSQSTVVRRFGATSAFFLSLPSSCDLDNQQPYMPDIGLIRNVADTSRVEVYATRSSSYPVFSEAVANGRVHRLHGQGTDTALSADEERLRKHLVGEWSNYRALLAVFFPENIWSGSEPLSSHVRLLSDVTLAKSFNDQLPIDGPTLRRALAETGAVVVVEDHRPAGGLGDAVLDALAEVPLEGRVVKLAVRGMPGSGTPDELRAWAGIDAASIARAALEAVGAG